ncbi:MAG: hypothetical protein RL701_7191 [Pseudomonadota bacterium]
MKVLVTGASRGIGRAIALAFGARGAGVALAVREPSGPAVLELLASIPGARAVPVDLSDSAQTQTLIERAREALGGLDVLVNCAGIVHYEALADLSPESLLQQLTANFVAPTFIARDAALHMQAHGGGAIVNVASTLGVRPAPLTAAYAASKAALISMTRSLALEFGAAGVRVNAVAPGIIDTDMIRAERPNTAGAAALSVEEQLAGLRKLHVLGRLGTAEEIAQSVLYLVDAQFVTGTVLIADGGLLL